MADDQRHSQPEASRPSGPSRYRAPPGAWAGGRSFAALTPASRVRVAVPCPLFVAAAPLARLSAPRPSTRTRRSAGPALPSSQAPRRSGSLGSPSVRRFALPSATPLAVRPSRAPFGLGPHGVAFPPCGRPSRPLRPRSALRRRCAPPRVGAAAAPPKVAPSLAKTSNNKSGQPTQARAGSHARQGRFAPLRGGSSKRPSPDKHETCRLSGDGLAEAKAKAKTSRAHARPKKHRCPLFYGHLRGHL